ncbi:MAG: hypothetical protein KDA61_13050, partial [Planctomycetales bacterium]|nr:hypothetical protein [Planctomycetales bacterium]
GGETAKLVADLADATNWRAYDVSEKGFISFGWRPTERVLSGPGDFRPWDWHLASDEERLVYFLAAGSGQESFAGDPRDYYRLERHVKRSGDGPPYVVSWNGSMFTYFFSHCWIDYRSYGVDDPQAFDVEQTPVDWVENSRRATLTHRRQCQRAQGKFASFSTDRWGLAPCMGVNGEGRLGYLVQAVRPSVMDADQWDGGTIAPYAAGAALMFTPQESMAALHAFRALSTAEGLPLAFRDPAGGGYGMADSFNLDFGVACDDNVAIDVGPFLLGMENSRTGLVWKLFMRHPVAQRAVGRLRWRPWID